MKIISGHLPRGLLLVLASVLFTYSYYISSTFFMDWFIQPRKQVFPEELESITLKSLNWRQKYKDLNPKTVTHLTISCTYLTMVGERQCVYCPNLLMACSRRAWSLLIKFFTDYSFQINAQSKA